MDAPTNSGIVEPVEETVRRKRAAAEEKPKRQPRYHVVLWNDDDHSYAYVIAMLQRLFGYPIAKGFKLAEEVDHHGKAIVLTTTREHAELKRDQIHAFGADARCEKCAGSMSASLEADE